ncbi:MAG: hypothetical protein AAFZ17_07310 [Cyanobacteria bacterium J06650_10]
MAEFKATVAGKNIVTYVPRGNKKYTHQDISQYLKKFKLNDALRLIGEAAYNVFQHTEGTPDSNGIPVTIGTLAYLSMHLIEDSNDYRSSDMTNETLLTAIDMYCGLADPFMANNEDPLGCLLRAGAAQFDYDRELRHTIPRALLLYEEIWNEVEEAKDIDIADAIRDMTGLSLQELLILNFVFFSTAHKGYLQIVENLEQFPEPLREVLSLEKQQAFLNWISCSYQDFRTLSRADIPPSDEYEHFRFNPLYLKPAITPDRTPKQGMEPVYITPVPTLINYRATNGLYFALSDYFRELTRNQDFRNAFGHVFQRYVGRILKQAFGEENVIAEWQYTDKKNRKDTPDWIVICNGRAILLEVKQSGLYLPAKKWAKEADIKKDLKRTIGKGALQMWIFHNDLDRGICKPPKKLDGVKISERIVVTFDRSYFLNSVMPDKVREIYPNLPADYHWHTIAVEELEYLLNTESDLASFLAQKRGEPDYDKMDFKDYHYHSRADSKDSHELKNTYLDSIFETFFDGFGLDQLSEKLSGS